MSVVASALVLVATSAGVAVAAPRRAFAIARERPPGHPGGRS